MRTARNIMGILAIAAVIASGALFGMPQNGQAAGHVPQVHTNGSPLRAHASHQVEHHGHHDHDQAYDEPVRADHSNHGPCNAMACCPVVSISDTSPQPFFLAHSICHRPYEGPSLVQAAAERADKPPKHT